MKRSFYLGSLTLLSAVACACSPTADGTEPVGTGGETVDSTTGGASADSAGGAPAASGGNTGGAATGNTGGNASGGHEPGAAPTGSCRSFANGSGSTQPCYVANDGEAYCIADDGQTTALSGVTGTALNATGQNFTTSACAVNTDGAVFCGQYASMTQVIDSGASQVSGSLDGWCAVVDGGVKCNENSEPTLPAGTVTQVACYYHGCCAATSEGKMICWGDTTALGGTGTDVVEVPAPAGKKVVQLGPGQDHICALFEGGQVQCWGKDWNKQLGGLGENSTTGQTLAASGAVSVAGGQFHTCIAFEDGSVQCVSGAQSEGAGLDAGSLTPVSGITNAIALSAGKHYSCALLGDGGIKCWGRIGGGTTPIDVQGPAAAACR